MIKAPIPEIEKIGRTLSEEINLNTVKISEENLTKEFNWHIKGEY